MSIIKNLSCHLGDFHLDIPHLEIPDKGVTVLWGPSGSGKSTLFRCLLGLEKGGKFQWLFQDEDLAKKNISERRLGVVFQSYDLFPHMTAKDNLLFMKHSCFFNKKEFDTRWSELIESLKLSSFLDKKAEVLSGGEQQRVALARALLISPRLLLLDEPFSALDPSLKEEARGLIKQVLDKQNIPVLLITHDEKDVASLAQHTVKIKDGKLF